mmetsp:Transcript_9958/g.15356  ORF Transcript_9958/g.15356 Transcript_9958/m.15356 type:complete len:247 (-) Transcript_9958:111-851(-)|eukprot:CAMPEP_0195297668 /NCGR_PEP_ID=MMETSP0707-20130614/21978_1 /TAXON_ID=33640 /ORGANISM="Asterionellopsis glacialis, Strain CCMP134" /LENGTH=246 /DNA_ID=CAMNT_0040359555 /DNA_START=192 /DNA_END=932 /DNA_ORIENTATION=+
MNHDLRKKRGVYTEPKSRRRGGLEATLAKKADDCRRRSSLTPEDIFLNLPSTKGDNNNTCSTLGFDESLRGSSDSVSTLGFDNSIKFLSNSESRKHGLTKQKKIKNRVGLPSVSRAIPDITENCPIPKGIHVQIQKSNPQSSYRQISSRQRASRNHFKQNPQHPANKAYLDSMFAKTNTISAEKEPALGNKAIKKDREYMDLMFSNHPTLPNMEVHGHKSQTKRDDAVGKSVLARIRSQRKKINRR